MVLKKTEAEEMDLATPCKVRKPIENRQKVVWEGERNEEVKVFIYSSVRESEKCHPLRKMYFYSEPQCAT